MTHTNLQEPFSARLVRGALGCAAVLCGCCFLFVAWQSFWDTCWLTPEEKTLFFRDSLRWQLVLLCGCAAVLWALTHLIHRLRWQRFVLPCTLGFTLVCCCVWIWSANVAQLGESGLCGLVAQSAKSGDWYIFRPGQYMSIFPFQSGFVAYIEGLYAIFGQNNTAAVSAVSVVFVLAGHAALYCFTGRISPYPQAKTLTALLCAAAWPWMLYTTFNYGNFLSLTLCLWAGLALLAFLDALAARGNAGFPSGHTSQNSPQQLPSTSVSNRQATGKRQRQVPSATQQPPIKSRPWLCFAAAALLLSTAMLLKSTALIPLIAFCVVLALAAVRQRQWQPLLALIALCAVTFVPLHAAQAWYEARSGESLGNGTPKLVWISMGLEEGEMAMGWFNGKTYSAMPDANMDAQACIQQQKQDIAARLAVFQANPAYARNFLLQKHNSQWLDPSFGAININAISRDTSPSRWSALTQYLYSRTQDSFFIRVSGAWQTLVYAMAALGMLALAMRPARVGNRRCIRFGTDADAALLAVMALGGYLYLMLAEAKSQYAFSYYLMLFPYAAHGLCTAWHLAVRGIKKCAAARKPR